MDCGAFFVCSVGLPWLVGWLVGLYLDVGWLGIRNAGYLNQVQNRHQLRCRCCCLHCGGLAGRGIDFGGTTGIRTIGSESALSSTRTWVARRTHWRYCSMAGKHSQACWRLWCRQLFSRSAMSRQGLSATSLTWPWACTSRRLNSW